MKILLIKPNDQSVVEINGTCNHGSADTVLPWSLIMLATMLREAGHEVNVLDAEVKGLSFEETAAAITANQPERVIAPVNPILLRHSTAWRALWNGPTSFLLNEPFKSWVQKRLPDSEIIDGDWFSKILGTTILPKDYPVADFSFVDAGCYTRQQILITEGCNHACHFCHFGRTMGRGWSARSIPTVIEELRRLRAIGRRFISIFDNELALDREYCLELMSAIKTAKLDILWETNSRVSSLDDALVKAMADAGCVYSGYGLECAVQSVLDANSKEITVEQIVEAHRLFKRHNIMTRTYVLVGIHGQGQEDVLATANFIKHTLRQQDTSFDLVIPMPGTPLEKELKRQSKLFQEVTPANKAWIAKHVYGDKGLDGEEMEKPAWNYEKIPFDSALSLVHELRKKVQSPTAWQKAMALFSRPGGARLMAASALVNPLKTLRKLCH